MPFHPTLQTASLTSVIIQSSCPSILPENTSRTANSFAPQAYNVFNCVEPSTVLHLQARPLPGNAPQKPIKEVLSVPGSSSAVFQRVCNY